jgi:hypothetical protein
VEQLVLLVPVTVIAAIPRDAGLVGKGTVQSVEYSVRA